MYESPLFLAAHDEDGGGRSVPTTPLQVAAPGEKNTQTPKKRFPQSALSSSWAQKLSIPCVSVSSVTVFTESLPSDSSDNMASQSVPMVTASTGMAATTDDGDEVFMEQEVEG